MGVLRSTLRAWAEAMAWHYAREIPDYARLDRALLQRDVAVVSYEYLLALEGEAEARVENVALAVGQRRQRQGISLPALLRAYRLWAKDALEALRSEAPGHLAELAPKVAEILDRVSEASARGYQLALEGVLPQGPLTGLAVGLKHAQTIALAPRYLGLPPERMAYHQAPFGPLLFLAAPLAEVEEGLKALARGCAACLWVAEGANLLELQGDLEEALALGHGLDLPPGVYPVRLLWPLAMALESPKGRDRLLRLLAPLGPHPELLGTLEAYLQARLSLKGAARRLGLHPNTVLYRLHRVEELTGLRLQRVEDLCLASMALQVRRLMGGPR
ncbi:transcriptional regulator [Thermus composti]|uniref:PucR family transcriptional regulator n=1 Tax=Thermus composti TaxID=532059 RepID=A0ABV6Q0L6_9DEIN|nr:helix-turn-helix domain-containing protein [Thermus composti]GGN02726.1 transcriptional regulator [Thermus composti]